MEKMLYAGTARQEIGVKDEKRLHDPLFVRVVVLNNQAEKFVIMALDAVAIGCIFDLSDAFLPALRDRIGRELGIPAEHMLVSATHTHTAGPMLRSEEEVVNACFEAVKNACKHWTPVVIGTGSGREAGLIMNRTLQLANGKHWTIRHTNCSPPEDLVAGLRPVDPEIGVVRIDRAMDGTPFAVLFNYGCHPLIGVPSGQVTANFPGVACDRIEKVLGHDSMALFLQGTGGDVIELLNKDFAAPRHAEPFGRALGEKVLDIRRTIDPKMVEIDCASTHTVFPRRNDGDERIAALRKEEHELLASLRYTSLNFKEFLPLYIARLNDPARPYADGFRYLHEQAIGDDALENLDHLNRNNIDKYLANVRAMEALAQIQDQIATFELHRDYNRNSGSETIDAELVALRIGDAVIISNPTEAVSEVGLRLKAKSPFAKTLFAPYSNGYMHYGAMPEDYDKGGYEVTECFLAPGWHAAFESAALKLLKKLHEAMPAKD